MPPINWSVVGPILAVALVALNTVLTVVIAKWANAPKWLRVVQGLLADIITNIPGVPGSQTHTAINYQPPVIGQPVKTSAGSAPIGKITVIALALFVASQTAACASISWTTPVMMFGPVAGIEEVSKAHPAPATAAGFQLEVGLGQFDFQGHEFDLLDPGVLVLGGVVLPGAGPVGELQVGGEIGTLNGIFGIAILGTPYAVDGSGFAQGGSPGTTFGAMVNVAALTAYLTSSPKGELGGPERL